MLVIGREIGEVIAIDGDIRIKVLGVDGGIVRFGIQAPKKVRIYRSEIYRQVVQAQGKGEE